MLLTDTVGFVRKLPHQLVEAFRSTLEVVAEADLLVHVVDAIGARPAGADRRGARRARRDRRRRRARAAGVQQGRPRPRCGQAHWSRRSRVGRRSRPLTGEGIDELLRTIGDRLRALADVVELVVPYDRGDVLAAVHREGEVLVARPTPTSTCVVAGPTAMRASVGQLQSIRCAIVTEAGFEPPPYPYDRLDGRRPVGRGLEGGSSTCRSARRATRRRRP